VFEKYIYIMVYGHKDSPHTLPTFITDRFILKEIAYQTTRIDLIEVLKDSRKSI
jgi:hypothetical protein